MAAMAPGEKANGGLRFHGSGSLMCSTTNFRRGLRARSMNWTPHVEEHVARGWEMGSMRAETPLAGKASTMTVSAEAAMDSPRHCRRCLPPTYVNHHVSSSWLK